jgi:hypothetical protein
MDNAQKHNICTNVPSSQAFTSYVLLRLTNLKHLESVLAENTNKKRITEFYNYACLCTVPASDFLS